MSTTQHPSGGILRRVPATVRWRLLGLLVYASSAWPVVNTFLIKQQDEIWQVDLEVYREGSHSLVLGRPVYDFLTSAPQYLPMTYPPFADLLGTPLLVVPFRVAGWVWTFLQLWLLWITVTMAFRSFLERCGPFRGLVHGGLAAVLIQLQPVADGIRFGQVNAVLVALCLADAVRGAEGRWPRGSLVGIATAVKLTPAVFWIHWATVRRWRVLAVSMLTAVAVTALTALIAPSSSAAFWTQALLDPGRLGPNAGTANQSMRGVLLRIGPPPGTPAFTLIWLGLVLVVGVSGFRLARKLHLLGEPVAVVGAVGMLAVLISPVSWVHHLHWGVVVIGALLGDARYLRRVAVAALATLVLYLKLPWWGGSWVLDHEGNYAVDRFVESSYCWFAVLALVALWWFLARGRSVPSASGPSTAAAQVAAADDAEPAAADSRLTDGLIGRR